MATRCCSPRDSSGSAPPGRHTEVLKQLCRPRPQRGGRRTARTRRRQHDIVERAHFLDEVKVLEHEAGMRAPPRIAGRFIEPGELRHHPSARCRYQHAAGRSARRAGSICPEPEDRQGDDTPRLDRERDGIEHRSPPSLNARFEAVSGNPVMSRDAAILHTAQAGEADKAGIGVGEHAGLEHAFDAQRIGIAVDLQRFVGIGDDEVGRPIGGIVAERAGGRWKLGQHEELHFGFSGGAM